MTNLNKNVSVLIATFSPWVGGRRLPTNGNLEPMRDFFVPKVKKTVIIDQVYPGSDFVMPRIEVYQNKKTPKIKRPSWWLYALYPLLRLFNYGGTQVVFKLRDFLSVVEWGMRDKGRYDIFIGLEAVNALAGVALRRLGKVNTVIYYVSDYSPKRYRSPWFNRLYLWLDRQAAMLSDFIWDVSPAIAPARIKAGLEPRRSAPVICVPNALYPSQIYAGPSGKRQPCSLVFMGTLGPENGPDLAIKAVSYLVRKIPRVSLHIVGGGREDLKRLKALAGRLNILSHVIFHGFIADRDKVSQLISRYQVAVAPYRAIPGSPRWFGDATKIRAYMAAGLPTVTTQVPPLGRDIAAQGAGAVVNDDPKRFAEAIFTILKDRKLYLFMREKAIAFAKANTWENEFTRAFAAMGKHKMNSWQNY